ncbi:MAG: hypothetical protein Tsb0020_29150 [Haliangiales bacterium]
MLDSENLFFVVVVLSATALVTMWLLRALGTGQADRARRLQERSSFEAIRPKRGVEPSKEVAVERGLASINARYRLARIALVVLFPSAIATVLIIPSIYDWPSNYISLVFGAVTVVIGIAAKPFIENVISGLVLSFSQVVRIGDTVDVSGQYGTVEGVGLVYTVIKVWDWQRWVIPNSEMLKREFLNYSLHSRDCWAKVEFTVSTDANIGRVREICIDAANQSQYFADYEPPSFWLMALEKDCIRCWVAAWASSPANAWELKNDIRTAIVNVFQREGIKTHKMSMALEPRDAGPTPRARADAAGEAQAAPAAQAAEAERPPAAQAERPQTDARRQTPDAASR